MNIEEIIKTYQPSQNHWEMLQVIQIVSQIKPRIIVEIGVHLGKSMRVWKDVFKPEVLLGIEKEISPDFSDLEVIVGNSHDPSVLDKVKELRQIDFLYIDGDHSLSGVCQDFLMYKDLVKEGGIIGFHDISLKNHDKCEVYGLWSLLKHRYNFIEINSPLKGTGTGLIFNWER